MKISTKQSWQHLRAELAALPASYLKSMLSILGLAVFVVLPFGRLSVASFVTETLGKQELLGTGQILVCRVVLLVLIAWFAVKRRSRISEFLTEWCLAKISAGILHFGNAATLLCIILGTYVGVFAKVYSPGEMNASGYFAYALLYAVNFPLLATVVKWLRADLHFSNQAKRLAA